MLYEKEMSSLKLREKYKSRVFEKRALKKNNLD
jgi:hypothetical protein